ncbi:MAG: dihydroneopterin aldolase [Polyangiaceae bacterium]|jgi:dihydroneopterin aldolase|nr:dihydroneopterin aldolase [Polyangiaceae bacterium]
MTCRAPGVLDKVIVRGIRVQASIGLRSWEREVRQPIEVDVEADVDTDVLLRTNNLEHGVDFDVVMDTVRDLAGGQHTELVEELADRIARALVERTQAPRVRVQVRKYSACASVADHVGVEVVRCRLQTTANVL